MSSEVTVDRLQFTLTVTFHYLFPILTMGVGHREHRRLDDG